MARRGLSLVDDIFNRIKELEGISTDVDLAPILHSNRLQPGQWRSRKIVPWERIVEYARRRQLSLEYIVNGNGPPERTQLMAGTAEPGAIYRVQTDQDQVFELAERILTASQAMASPLPPAKFGQLLRLLHREWLDTGCPPPDAKLRELIRFAQ